MIDVDPDLNHAPNEIKHVHIMGICGTGMAALAGMLQQSGFTITGSDAGIYPPMSTFLQELGIELCEGYKPENLTPAPDLVIVGNVIRKTNPEAQALARLGLPYLSFPQALSHFFIQSRKALVIAGTHGKTTSCSMLATSLFHAGIEPTFMIGGIVREFDANFRLGNGKYFVAEGDEYDTAFFDKGSKFLHYQPHIAVITSIEFDHADIFENLDAIKRSFEKFVALLPEDGLLIANFDDPDVVEIAQKAVCRVESYGLDPQYTWSFSTPELENGISTFQIQKEAEPWTEISLAMCGQHNCLNALAVCAVMNQVGIRPSTIADCLRKFSGVKRRQEVRGIANGITVIDDFAHHPTAVRETLGGLRAGYPGYRLVVVFEPRTNSSRRSIFQKEYVNAFNHADLVLIREPVPVEGLPEDQLFSSRTLAEDLRSTKKIQAKSFEGTDQILIELKEILKEGDVVAILSNGGFDNIHERLLTQLIESASLL